MKIQGIIDKYFDFMQQISGCSFMEEMVPESMLNREKKGPSEGIVFWNAIPSTITQNEVEKLESYFKHQLPQTYKDFLQHRHFLELDLGEHSIGFFKSLPQTFVNDTIEKIESDYPGLVERNYLPIADLSDFGVVCFDANEMSDNNNYPIVGLSHEDEYEEIILYFDNFETMFEDFEKHLDDWIATKN